MAEYDSFAPLYDQVMGDAADRIRLLDGLIQNHCPHARTVLELGCGTGTILKGLATHYAFSGVDISPRMLEIAEEKVPSAELSLQDMSQFSFARKFDVILCVFDSINHLTAFSQWESVFQKAAAHLNDGGLFVFDMNTASKLERLADAPAREEASKVVIKVDRQGGYFVWHISPKEAADTTSETHILEVSFPITDVTSAIEKHFDVVESFDDDRSQPTEESRRVFFVCRKK